MASRAESTLHPAFHPTTPPPPRPPPQCGPSTDSMPAPHAPVHRAQTIKQAKAAYKSRHQVHLSEREKKQIERSIELDRRAWRAKEAEKRKAEAKAKRDEREKKERERDVSAAMTSQRRCDRFGFAGSQMHLGALFGGRRGGQGMNEGARGRTGDVQEEAWDGDLDDESMLEALDEGGKEGQPQKHFAAGETRSAAADTRIPRVKATVTAPPSDLDLFWDDLDTSTQIARDLATDSASKATSKPKSAASSFSSEDFDISVEDIEETGMADESQARKDQDKKLMPPPALPVKQAPALAAKPPPRANLPAALRQTKTAMLPLPGLVQQPSRELPSKPTNRVPVARTAPKPSFSSHLGITLAELESFVDDDLQLTQVDPV